MDSRRYLLGRLAASHATQPATLLWRVFEVEAVLAHARLAGSGVDIGCGDGGLAAIVFGQLGARSSVVGIEPDPADAAAAARSGVYARVHRTTGDAVPEPSARSDFVFSNSTLEHIDAVEPVIAEAARLLRPGGRFVFTVPSEQFRACLRGDPLIALLARRRGQTYLDALDARLAHRAYRDPEEWTVLLRRAGLKIERAIRYFPEEAVRAWERSSDLTGGVLYELLAGRRHPRRIQRAIGLARQVPPPIATAVAALVAVIFRQALSAQMREGRPSGGLLVIASR